MKEALVGHLDINYSTDLTDIVQTTETQGLRM